MSEDGCELADDPEHASLRRQPSTSRDDQTDDQMRFNTGTCEQPIILARFVAGGGSVVLSSHVMALVEQLCDTVAIMVKGRVVAAGPLDEVRGEGSLEETFVRLVGGDARAAEGLSWLAS